MRDSLKGFLILGYLSDSQSEDFLKGFLIWDSPRDSQVWDRWRDPQSGSDWIIPFKDLFFNGLFASSPSVECFTQLMTGFHRSSTRFLTISTGFLGSFDQDSLNNVQDRKDSTGSTGAPRNRI